MSNSTLTRKVTVRNPQGLHARPADMVVRMANQFDSTISLEKSGESVDCKSILSLLTLGASQGTELTLSAEGDDAADAIESIGRMFESGFDEIETETKDTGSAIDS